jgi:hypothetical protein
VRRREATTALKRLLSANARIRVKSGNVRRAGKRVNAALIRSGSARAAAGASRSSDGR